MDDPDNPVKNISNYIVVSWSSTDVKNLIAYIEANRQLYDMDSTDYNNREVVDVTWRDISRQLGKPTRECREKWYNLRTVYRRLLRETVALEKVGKCKSKRWVWLDAMSFLKPFLRSKNGSLFKNQSRSLFPAEIMEEELDEVDKVDEVDEEENTTTNNYGHQADLIKIEISDHEDYNTYQRSPPSQERKRQRLDDEETRENSSSDPIDCSTASTLKQGYTWSPVSQHVFNKTSTNIDESDPDLLFFRSLLPDMRQLSARKKGVFKLKVQQTLQDLLFPPEIGQKFSS